MNQNLLSYMYPQYTNYQHSPFNNHLRQPLPNNNLTISPSSSYSNIKATTRSPSLSPSSSSPDEDKFFKEDLKRNNSSLSPGFPRHSSIDSISSKFNKAAKIDTPESEYIYNKMNDENNNPIKIRPRSPLNMSTLNDKNLPHNSNSAKYNQQQFISQQQQQQQQQQYTCNNKLALTSGILNNNNKECNKIISNNRLDNSDITSSTLTIKPSNSNSSSNSGSNSSINNVASNSNNHSSSNNAVFVPPCTSNGISLELREKLRQNILKKQDKNKYEFVYIFAINFVTI